jgi:murein DD-endopeptidase MepM/ murein hydrolase activator NlpD
MPDPHAGPPPGGYSDTDTSGSNTTPSSGSPSTTTTPATPGGQASTTVVIVETSAPAASDTKALKWLKDKLSRLVVLAETYYSTLVSMAGGNVLGNISTLFNRADSIKSDVVSLTAWIKSQVNSLKNSISGAITEAKSYAAAHDDTVIGWALGQIISLGEDIAAAAATVKSWASVQISVIKEFVQSVRSSLLESLETRITSLRLTLDAFNTSFKALIEAARLEITNGLAALGVSLNARISDLDQRASLLWMTFMQNLMPTIWGAIEAYVQDWLAWWLASLLYNGKGERPVKPPLPGYSGSFYDTGSMIPTVGGIAFTWPTVSRYLSGYSFGPTHKAIDIGISTGDPIKAVAAGTVTFSGWSEAGYGNMIKITHADGWVSLYAHLMQCLVFSGMNVSQGQVIGLGDSTGNSTGPHLHLEIRKGSTYYDPLKLLQ